MLSTSERRRYVTGLREFLEGRISVTDLNHILGDHVIIDFLSDGNHHRIAFDQELYLPDQIQVPFTREHICAMLRRFIEGAISSAALADWAAVIFLSEMYSFEGVNEEAVWDIMQQLMSPEVFRSHDSGTVNRFLHTLCNR